MQESFCGKKDSTIFSNGKIKDPFEKVYLLYETILTRHWSRFTKIFSWHRFQEKRRSKMIPHSYFGLTKPGLIKYAIVVSVSAIKASRHVVFTAATRPGQIQLSLLA